MIKDSILPKVFLRTDRDDKYHIKLCYADNITTKHVSRIFTTITGETDIN